MQMVLFQMIFCHDYIIQVFNVLFPALHLVFFRNAVLRKHLKQHCECHRKRELSIEVQVNQTDHWPHLH